MSLFTKSSARKSAALLAVGVLAVGATACEDDSSAGRRTADPSSEATDSPSESPAESPTDGGSTQDAGMSGGRGPTGTDMAADFELFKSWVDGYAEEKGLPVPDAWNFLSTGETKSTGCTDYDGDPAEADDTSYFYCGPDKAMYVGEVTMQQFADEFGPVAPGLGIAHEWGHHVQTELGIQADSYTAYIKFENQADCIAGSWYGDLTKDRGLDLMEAGKLGLLLAAIGEQEGPERTHGTPVERSTSALRGATLGLPECSKFFPDDPIVD